MAQQSENSLKLQYNKIKHLNNSEVQAFDFFECLYFSFGSIRNKSGKKYIIVI